jgi:DNA primase
MRPHGPYPILVLQGQPRNGKSLAAKMLKCLLDPTAVPFLPLPNNPNTLLRQANHSWIQAFDHVTAVPKQVSAALCRLSTGAGFSLVVDGCRGGQRHAGSPAPPRPCIEVRSAELAYQGCRHTGGRKPMIRWVDFAAVKRTVSLEAVVRHYQVPGLRRRRDQLQGCCPIHHGQRDDSFRIHLTRNIFQCFACQARGNVLDFVAAMEQCSIREAALRLQQWFGVGASGPRLCPAATAKPKGELVRKEEGGNLPLRFALTFVERNHPYLAQRGIDPAIAAEFGVGFYPGLGLMSGRIVIPIRNRQGQLVAYAGRALDDRPPKYKLPTGFRKALELFNLQRAVDAGAQTVIVVEGYFDCMRVHQAGFPAVVALMGCSLSAAQEAGLLHHFERIVLMLDGDAAGRAASEVIAARLSIWRSVQVLRIPKGSQPDQLSCSTIRQLLAVVACPNEGAMVKQNLSPA